MDLFYIIVLTVAVILLILTLTFLGIAMNKMNKETTVFPPTKSTCPDYWTTSTKDLSYCEVPNSNSRNIGSIYASDGKNNLESKLTPGYDANLNRIGFLHDDWSKGGTSTCNQQKWAKQYGVVWDGVTNYNGC
jgi:hypothetical protein